MVFICFIQKLSPFNVAKFTYFYCKLNYWQHLIVSFLLVVEFLFTHCISVALISITLPEVLIFTVQNIGLFVIVNFPKKVKECLLNAQK